MELWVGEFPLGGEGLAEAEAAVVGGDLMVGEGAEAAGLEVVFGEGEEEGVLEDAAAEGDGGKAGLLPGAVAGVGEEGGEVGVEGVGELPGEGATLSDPFGATSPRGGGCEGGEAAAGELGEELGGGDAEGGGGASQGGVVRDVWAYLRHPFRPSGTFP